MACHKQLPPPPPPHEEHCHPGFHWPEAHHWHGCAYQEGCGCIEATSRNAEAAGASASAAAQSALLAQKVLQNCLTDKTILPGGGLVYVEGTAPGEGGIAIDLAWLLAPDVLGQLAAALLKPGAGLGVEDGKLVLDTANMETAMFNKLLASLHLPRWISANLDLYVNGTSGADGPNRGAETAPYKTIQAACDYLCDNIHVGNHTVTIHVAPGVYEESIGLHEFNRSAGQAILRAEGGVTLKNSTASQAYVINAEGGVWTLEGFTIAMNIASAADNVRHAIYCNGADLALKNITAGVSQAASAILASPLLVNAGVARILEGCQLTGAHSGSDSNNIHAMLVQNGGRLALLASLSINGAFNVVAHAANRGMLERSPVTMPAVTGTATGKRYAADTGGSIQTLAGGDDYFPGSIAGTCDADTFSWYK